MPAMKLPKGSTRPSVADFAGMGMAAPVDKAAKLLQVPLTSAKDMLNPTGMRIMEQMFRQANPTFARAARMGKFGEQARREALLKLLGDAGK